MKPYYKIILICLVIFSLVVYITKKSIDHTFCKVNDIEIQTISSLIIYNKVKQV